MSSFDSATVREYLLELQDLIVARLEQVDGKLFRRDNWDKDDGCGGPSTALRTGSGRSCILEEGNVLERGGVAFSHVTGDKMPPCRDRAPPRTGGPPLVKWRYDWHPEPNTPEAELYEKFLVPRDWV